MHFVGAAFSSPITALSSAACSPLALEPGPSILRRTAFASRGPVDTYRPGLVKHDCFASSNSPSPEARSRPVQHMIRRHTLPLPLFRDLSRFVQRIACAGCFAFHSPLHVGLAYRTAQATSCQPAAVIRLLLRSRTLLANSCATFLLELFRCPSGLGEWTTHIS